MAELRDRLARGLAGRYENLRELGAGGMAVVYLAHDIRHGRDVAIKVLRDEVARSVGADRFLGEIHLAAKLAHPHILPLYDSGEAEGIVYFVMPNIEGRSVRDRLAASGQLPVDDAVRLATEIAGALDYAHRHGVVVDVTAMGSMVCWPCRRPSRFRPTRQAARRTCWPTAVGDPGPCVGAKRPAVSIRPRISRSGRISTRSTLMANIQRPSRPETAP